MVVQTAQITLPKELVDRLTANAASMGLDLAAYLVFLEKSRTGLLDVHASDAARFMFSNHGDSLRKLAR